MKIWQNFWELCWGYGSIRNEYQIGISFNLKTEQSYANEIVQMLQVLFGLEATIRFRPNYGAAEVIANGRELIEFLYSQKMVKGSKIRNGARLPDWIFETEATQKAAVRGLFDTDGCIYQHTYKSNGRIYQYPKLAFTSYSWIIREQWAKMITSLGYHPRIYRNRVYIYSQWETLRFFQEIGTRNSVYQRRFERFCQDIELEKLLCPA